MNYYIASSLENAPTVQKLAAKLNAQGWTQTYDWTTHGGVQGLNTEQMAEIAKNEIQGVRDADIVIVLLPGGRGTHVELGAAIAMNKLVFLYGKYERDFYRGGELCPFYKYPGVIEAKRAIDELLKEDCSTERKGVNICV